MQLCKRLGPLPYRDLRGSTQQLLTEASVHQLMLPGLYPPSDAYRKKPQCTS